MSALPEGLVAPGSAPLFPPRLRGEEARPGEDVLDRAAQRAALGIDPGLIVWRAGGETVEAAVVLAPEVPLERAMGAVLAVANGLGDAIGALAPPEVAVHFDWPDGLRVNGARAGGFRARASTDDPAAEPDWLAIAIRVDLLPPVPPTGDVATDATGLYAEGCGEIAAVPLIESWSRHMLVWLNRLEDDGLAPVHRDWRARAWGMGEDLAAGGTFMGLDEHGGQLVRHQDRTELRPLTTMLAR